MDGFADGSTGGFVGGAPDAPAEQGPAGAACPVGRAREWAVAAAIAATAVPAEGAEAAAWITRGWADVALGCLTLGALETAPSGMGLSGTGLSGMAAPGIGAAGRAALRGLDEVIRTAGLVAGGSHACRLRELRRLAGRVPPWYPRAQPTGPVRPVRKEAKRAARLLEKTGDLLVAVAAALPRGPACRLESDCQLVWGARYRPSPAGPYLTVRLPVSRALARRTWMCLPGPAGPGVVVLDVPSTAPAMAQQIWRGIHEGAHLDHLAAAARHCPAAPATAEFAAGLLGAESYAMAVELVAAVECVLEGQGDAARQLGAGLVERAARLPGGPGAAPEFAGLPTWAETYVLGPLGLLAGDATTAAPWLADAGQRDVTEAGLTAPLRHRWRDACDAYRPAAELASEAAELVNAGAAP